MLTKGRLEAIAANIRVCGPGMMSDIQELIAEIDRLRTPSGAAGVLGAHRRKAPDAHPCHCHDRAADLPAEQHRAHCPKKVAYMRQQKRGKS